MANRSHMLKMLSPKKQTSLIFFIISIKKQIKKILNKFKIIYHHLRHKGNNKIIKLKIYNLFKLCKRKEKQLLIVK